MPARETRGDVDAVTNDVEGAQVRKHLLPHRQRERAARILPAEERHFVSAFFEMRARWTRVRVEPLRKRVARGRPKMLYDIRLGEHEMRRHRLRPERSALVKNFFVDQHERDGLEIRLEIRAHEYAQLVEDLDEHTRPGTVHADDDDR